MSQESLGSLASTAGFTHDAAMDKFVEIFTARPVTAPRHSEEEGPAHSSKERRRPLFWQPFSAVTEPAPGLLVPLSGIL
eukprot:COSAG04_NODE_16108_length_509_cov_2.009756_1_plen_78_part_01